MRLSVIAAALALPTINASVSIGKVNNGPTVAWISDKLACTNSLVAPSDTNPCGRKFKLSNGYTYFVCQYYLHTPR
jgi:hypothetical protein